MTNNTSTSTPTIVDVKTAKAVVRHEKNRSKIVYREYIEANGVTLENVKDHVKALTTLAYPNVKPDASAPKDSIEYEAKCFNNRVRNGLNHNLGKTPEKSDNSDNLLTATGVERLATMIGAGADNEEVLKVILSEVAERMSK